MWTPRAWRWRAPFHRRERFSTERTLVQGLGLAHRPFAAFAPVSTLSCACALRYVPRNVGRIERRRKKNLEIASKEEKEKTGKIIYGVLGIVVCHGCQWPAEGGQSLALSDGVTDFNYIIDTPRRALRPPDGRYFKVKDLSSDMSMRCPSVTRCCIIDISRTDKSAQGAATTAP
jgi:hypothetical protein